MAIRKKNIELISHIEKTTKKAKFNELISVEFPNISKDDYLSIAEWLFKTYNSMSVVYNSTTNISLTIGL